MQLRPKTFLITGSAGFIGFHLASRLLAEGHSVIGIDELIFRPDLNLSSRRNEILLKSVNYRFHKGNLSSLADLDMLLEQNAITAVFHFAGTSNVQASLENPHRCFKNNMDALTRLLENLRGLEYKPMLFFASSASVYGSSDVSPFHEGDAADRPLSMYAVSKRSAELMLHMYAHTYGIKSAVFRLFSVYGPWINPDLAPLKFIRNILDGTPLELLNNGEMLRDMVYIDDVVDGILGVYAATKKSSSPPFDIFNLGSGVTRSLTEITELLSRNLGRATSINLVPYRNGRDRTTHADIAKIQKCCGFDPKMPLEHGLKLLCDWYLREFPPISDKIDESVSSLSSLPSVALVGAP